MKTVLINFVSGEHTQFRCQEAFTKEDRLVCLLYDDDGQLEEELVVFFDSMLFYHVGHEYDE